MIVNKKRFKMIKCQISFGVLIASIILLTGFKKNIGQQNISSKKSADTYKRTGIFGEPVKVSIANATAVQSDRGQRPVKVMVYLSRAATEPVTVKYNTENGSAKAGVDYVAANGTIIFQPGEVAKWIDVGIIGEVAADADEGAPADDVSFTVMITEAIGVSIDMARAFVTILKNIARNPSIVSAGGNAAVYEVIISYTGYTSFAGTSGDCGIRNNGVVTLSGLFYGIENVNSYDNIRYEGDLQMIIDIDICSMKRLSNGEDRFCGIRVEGSGKVFTELEIEYDTETTGRGGYIKIENKDGQFRRTVTGDCDAAEIDEEWTMVPNKSISSVFNGNELSMLTGRTLRSSTYPKTYTRTDNDGNRTVVEVLRKIR
jgi:hypothetical protein